MIDQKQLRSLIRLMRANDLTELEIHDKDQHVKLKRGPEGGPPVVTAIPTLPAAAVAPVPAAAPAAAASAAAPAAPAQPTINSPMVGTFYAAPSPDAKPFVGVGDRVDADTVVCLIEAMKVFNEIKAETDGTITKVLAESGQAVEFGQSLFAITPD